MQIRPITSLQELQSVFRFVKEVLQLPDSHPRDYSFYSKEFNLHPNLLLVAKANEKIIGALLAIVENDHVLIGELAVSQRYNLTDKSVGFS